MKIFKKIASILTVLVLIVSLTSIITPQKTKAATNDSKMMTLVLTQTGSLTDADYSAIGESEVTDVVIIPESASVYGSNEAGYKNILAPIVIDVIDKLVNKDGDIRIYLGTPLISSSNFGLASSSLDPFYNYITYVRDKIGTKWSNVRGIYMNQESIYGSVNYTNILGNKEIKLMNDLSYRVHSLNKQFLWIPYYGYGTNAATTIKNLGYVINTTNIYDLAILQPHYYFDASVQANLDGVYYSVKNKNNPAKQGVSYRDGVVVVPKTSNTIIGAEMESNWKIATQYPNPNYADFQQRYDEYVAKFTDLKGSYPLAFYWDGKVQDALDYLINPFYIIPI